MPERDEALNLFAAAPLAKDCLELACPEALIPAQRQGPAASPRHTLLDGEPLSPFCPASLQHFPTTQGLHALAESVRLLSAPDIRLKCSLHEIPFRS